MAAAKITAKKSGLSNTQLLTLLEGDAKAGTPFASAVAFLKQFGYTQASIEAQLRSAGLSSTQITKITTSKGSTLKTLLSSAAGAALFIPGASLLDDAGSGADTAATGAGTAAESGAGAAGATTAADTAAKAIKTLSTGAFLAKLANVQTWIRVAEVLAGAILFIMALRQLASVASGSQQIKTVSVPKVVPV